jgi:hypothetical protein
MNSPTETGDWGRGVIGRSLTRAVLSSEHCYEICIAKWTISFVHNKRERERERENYKKKAEDTVFMQELSLERRWAQAYGQPSSESPRAPINANASIPVSWYGARSHSQSYQNRSRVVVSNTHYRYKCVLNKNWIKKKSHLGKGNI